jgi:hypothetical protein
VRAPLEQGIDQGTMRYQTNGDTHILTLTKDEMLTVVNLLYDGLEYSRIKMNSGDKIAREKYLGSEPFLAEFKKIVLSTDVKQ